MSRGVSSKCVTETGRSDSPVPFNLILEVAVRNITESPRKRLSPLIAYADDVAIVARSAAALKNALGGPKKGAAKYGLEVNEENTKYMGPLED
uniref:Reverse transcriptase domain-containing protein n=1 Tax=Triatoma infestans TaxID=30076 RepID=A0A170U4V5_TRIIF